MQRHIWCFLWILQSLSWYEQICRICQRTQRWSLISLWVISFYGNTFLTAYNLINLTSNLWFVIEKKLFGLVVFVRVLCNKVVITRRVVIIIVVSDNGNVLIPSRFQKWMMRVVVFVHCVCSQAILCAWYRARTFSTHIPQIGFLLRIDQASYQAVICCESITKIVYILPAHYSDLSFLTMSIIPTIMTWNKLTLSQ